MIFFGKAEQFIEKKKKSKSNKVRSAQTKPFPKLAKSNKVSIYQLKSLTNKLIKTKLTVL